MTILQVGGPRGVGRSTVAWALFAQLMGEGTVTGYVDLAQLGFSRPAPTAAVLAHDLDAVWRTYRDAGARRLIVSGGPTGLRPDITLCWLRARPDTLLERLLMRGRGEGPPIPGDDLRGRPPAELRRLAVPDEPPAGADLVLDTDGRTVAELVAAVREGLRW